MSGLNRTDFLARRYDVFARRACRVNSLQDVLIVVLSAQLLGENPAREDIQAPEGSATVHWIKRQALKLFRWSSRGID